MKYLSAKVIFEHPEPAMTADLIAEVFHGFGIQGVVIEIPGRDNNVDWADDAPEAGADSFVIGYFPVSNQTDAWCKKLDTGLRGLQRTFSFHYEIQYGQVDEEDWSESWKAYFWPERITERLVIKPTWRKFEVAPEDIVLEIDPGMAFGTGTHPTSALCLALIEEHIREGDRFLDVGTGSGILLVAAAKLGAAGGLGIDNDPVAVDVAKTNLTLNQIDGNQFQVIQGDLTDTIDARFDIVAANILTPVILQLLKDMGRILSPGGIVIVSGITDENRSRVIEEISMIPMDLISVRAREGWVAMAARQTD